jgi:hypothetical protein
MKIFFLSLFILFCESDAQLVKKTMKNIPDTWQTKDYTKTFGEDSDYSLNPPGFIIVDNSTAIDTVTGLQWQRTDGGEMTFESAGLYCDTLTLGGFTDWRLPNCHELFSLLHLDKPNPALPDDIFPKTTAEYWWSSQSQVNDNTKAWVTNAGGGVGNHLKKETISAGGTKHYHVRAVRDIVPPKEYQSRYIQNADGTITDNLSGLIWKQQPLQDSLNWESALQIAEEANIAGINDWRLPNIKELQSINDEEYSNPSINPVFNGQITVGKYWSSTSLPNQTTKAWYLDTRFGITTYALKTDKLKVVLVRTANASLQAEESESILPYRIYSNNNRVHIESNYPIESLTCVDITGRKLFENHNQINSLDIPQNSEGCYIMSFTINGHTYRTSYIQAPR